jgi:hypothetical protein
MPTSTLPTSSILPIYNDASEIYITTPVKSAFSQEIEKVQKHAVQLADVLRQVTAKHQSNIGLIPWYPRVRQVLCLAC